MKKLFPLLLILMLSCSDDNSKPKSELDKLPPATQTGENTFGCLLDGKAFLPGGGINPLDCVYQYVDGGYYFALQGNRRNSLNHLISIAIATENLEIEEGLTYQLRQQSQGNAYGRFSYSAQPTFTSEIYTGELIITQLTPTTVSGTFWFDIVDYEGNLREIREGRFDMEYSN